MAVLPTPASPTKHGLFLRRRQSISAVRCNSSSRPISGSKPMQAARVVSSRPNCSRYFSFTFESQASAISSLPPTQSACILLRFTPMLLSILTAQQRPCLSIAARINSLPQGDVPKPPASFTAPLSMVTHDGVRSFSVMRQGVPRPMMYSRRSSVFLRVTPCFLSICEAVQPLSRVIASSRCSLPTYVCPQAPAHSAAICVISRALGVKPDISKPAIVSALLFKKSSTNIIDCTYYPMHRAAKKSLYTKTDPRPQKARVRIFVQLSCTLEFALTIIAPPCFAYIACAVNTECCDFSSFLDGADLSKVS
ncbi:putative uncharacterized protein [Ruminococcus sp. CAG:579]|nr:putative uncharacterized protein [Ruminococcus sp. CAG:579]